MSKRRKVPKPIQDKSTGSIPTQESNQKTSTNHENPIICFSKRDKKKYCFHDIRDLKRFFDFLDKIEQVTWQQIIESGGKVKTGLGYDKITDKNVLKQLPSYVPPDSNLFELRVNDKGRAFAFTDGAKCYFVWWDQDHKIC
jgi:hypothetical protein